MTAAEVSRLKMSSLRKRLIRLRARWQRKARWILSAISLSPDHPQYTDAQAPECRLPHTPLTLIECRANNAGNFKREQKAA